MAKVSILETGLWDVPRNEIIQAETPEIYAENRRHTIPGYCVLVQDKKLGNKLAEVGLESRGRFVLTHFRFESRGRFVLTHFR